MVNVLDDSYTKSSPCNKCPRHLKGLSKDSCLAKCKQLDAYRSGEPWEGLEWVEIAQQDPEKIKENKEVVAMEEGKIDEHRTSNIERPTSNEKNNQQSTIINQQSKVCVICHHPDKKIVNKRSQTCGTCYQRWIKGTAEHPTLGKFVPSQRHSPKSKISNPPPNQKSQKIKPRKKKKSLSLNPTMHPEEIGTKNIPGKLEHTPLAAGIVIDLDKYVKIKNIVDALAEKYFVTPELVVIGLLGEALAGREKNRDQKPEVRG